MQNSGLAIRLCFSWARNRNIRNRERLKGQSGRWRPLGFFWPWVAESFSSKKCGRLIQSQRRQTSPPQSWNRRKLFSRNMPARKVAGTAIRPLLILGKFPTTVWPNVCQAPLWTIPLFITDALLPTAARRLTQRFLTAAGKLPRLASKAKPSTTKSAESSATNRSANSSFRTRADGFKRWTPLLILLKRAGSASTARKTDAPANGDIGRDAA